MHNLSLEVFPFVGTLPTGQWATAMYRPEQNHILGGLPAPAQARLFPSLELMPLPFGKPVHEPGNPVQYAYFPVDCMLSLLYGIEAGVSTEVSVVGREGVVGVSVFMGGDSTGGRAVVQSAGTAYRLSGPLLMEEFNRHGELLYLVLLYMQSLNTQMGQIAACNRHHSVGQQLCRWLLCALDRLYGPDLHVTLELIASMLRVRREGVTEAADELQKLGVIEYTRGRITVVDRHALERLSCECYRVVKKEADRLIPPTRIPRRFTLTP